MWENLVRRCQRDCIHRITHLISRLLFGLCELVIWFFCIVTKKSCGNIFCSYGAREEQAHFWQLQTSRPIQKWTSVPCDVMDAPSTSFGSESASSREADPRTAIFVPALHPLKIENEFHSNLFPCWLSDRWLASVFLFDLPPTNWGVAADLRSGSFSFHRYLRDSLNSQHDRNGTEIYLSRAAILNNSVTWFLNASQVMVGYHSGWRPQYSQDWLACVRDAERHTNSWSYYR